MAHSSMSNHYRVGILAVAVAFAVAASLASGEPSSGFSLELHHRSSPEVQQLAESRGYSAWPAGVEHGSPEYYFTLFRHDRALFARRGLAEGGDVTFADGNATFRLDGSLHYAVVAVGTPNTTLLVALDTGSDLFWVPCDCKQCAALNVSGTEPLRPYSPSTSSTSKAVTCAHALCDRPNACTATRGNGSSCPYEVQYVSANTSSSGVLVEDMLYLSTETGAAAQASIVFGCGQVQTGDFLDGAAADGLMGLGMDKVSVPSVLASTGLVKTDSFSMCFSMRGVGRINFGDAGDLGQSETPFIIRRTFPTYNISITSMDIGAKTVAVGFAAVVDSGTSFTYLNDPAYSAIATNFNSQVKEKRTNFSTDGRGSLPFDYCYKLGSDQTGVELPVVSLTTKGGAVFPVLHPIALISGQLSDGKIVLMGYCLAIIKNDIAIDIIGQNFMTGLKVVFNREKSVLGWQKFDCYKDVKTGDDTADGSPSTAAPAPEPTAHHRPVDNDATTTNTSFPGAAPLPRPIGAGHAGQSVSLSLTLLLLLLAAAAAV